MKHYNLSLTPKAALLFLVAAFLFIPVPASAQSSAGITRLPTDYIGFIPPAAGASFNDPVYGSLITRLTDGPAQFKDTAHHEYATMSPFNKDNSRILLLIGESGYCVSNRRGQVVIPPAEIELKSTTEPRWSATDPDIFYFHESNQLKQYNLATRQKSVVNTFSQYSKINFGGGESDISESGDRIIVIGDGRYVSVYRFNSNLLGPVFDVKGLGSFDYFDMTSDNNVIVRWGKAGVKRYQGIELFDANMNFIRQVTTFGGHADRGRDLNGDEVLLVVGANDKEPPPGCENNGVEKVRLSDGRRTCLIGLDWNAEVHVSANTDGHNPWVLISTTDATSGTANPPAKLAANWQQLWGPQYNELILVKMDGTEQRRLAHHRSRVIGDYWYAPRAAISRDGKYAVFDSNFGFDLLPDYTDVYLLELHDKPLANVSAADYKDAPLAVEAITAAFGEDLASAVVVANGFPLPTTLAGVSVKVRDSAGTERSGPLFFVSPTQVNYQMPPGTAIGPATVSISNQAGVTSVGSIQVVAVHPSLFAADASGMGLPVATLLRVFEDGSQRYEPIAQLDPTLNKHVPISIDLGAGSEQIFLVLYGTGIRFRHSLSMVEATVGGAPAQVLFAGAQSDFTGLDQVNIALPRSLAGRGPVDVRLIVDGQASNPVQVVIK